MVRTLQRKFAAASMLAVTLLLLTLVGAINLLNAVSVTRRQGEILQMLCEMNASPEKQAGSDSGGPAYTDKKSDADLEGQADSDPERQAGAGRKRKTDEDSGRPLSDAEERGQKDPKDSSASEGIRRRKKGLFGRGISVDNALSARFFAVWFDEEGEILRTDVSRIFSVDEEEAGKLAGRMTAAGKEQGTLEGFRFRVCDAGLQDSEDSGAQGRLLVAMDISGDRADLLSVLGISALIAALCWAAMLFPVHALARRAITPTAISIERQKQFVTNAGHELKTPLAIIQANTEALELYNGESKWTRNIRTQTERLNSLMQNLLTLSRMDEIGAELERKPFLSAPLILEVWEHFETLARAGELTVRMEVSPEEEIRVQANRESIAQLLSILFDNAVKYTPRGGEIRVFMTEKAETVELNVSNTVSAREEAGVLREDPERLFERFYRADDDRSRKKGGYGIGLSAARAIAEANQGTIRAACTGDRLVFTVCLRAAK